ncbi:MAG: ribosome biogenesis GTPase YlqF [Clostridia bacterium]|nr:ribosome biogenesis GTPase YlqF [Clostridia bacterium]
MSDAIKQTVQWFPGHMAKTRRLIKEYLPKVDCVAELLDARIPLSSRNPEINELTSGKPRIVLLNKCDVADESTTKMWLQYFQSAGQAALAVDCRSGKGLQSFDAVVKEVLKDKIRSNEEKGMAGRALRIMVVGIPNTGKSSFINRMAKRNRAKVADRPGVTRQNQWFAIGNGLELLDTPGVLWPKFDDPAVGDKLAFIGSVKDEILDSETIACRLLKILRDDYPHLLENRYGFGEKELALEEPYELLEALGRKRGMLVRGGEINTERAAVTLLDEYRGGKLGRLSLEKPI